MSVVDAVSARRVRILSHTAQIIECNLGSDMPDFILEPASIFPPGRPRILQEPVLCCVCVEHNGIFSKIEHHMSATSFMRAIGCNDIEGFIYQPRWMPLNLSFELFPKRKLHPPYGTASQYVFHQYSTWTVLDGRLEFLLIHITLLCFIF